MGEWRLVGPGFVGLWVYSDDAEMLFGFVWLWFGFFFDFFGEHLLVEFGEFFGFSFGLFFHFFFESL